MNDDLKEIALKRNESGWYKDALPDTSTERHKRKLNQKKKLKLLLGTYREIAYRPVLVFAITNFK